MEPIKQTVENNLDSFAFQNYIIAWGKSNAAWEPSHRLDGVKLHMYFFGGQLEIGSFCWFTW